MSEFYKTIKLITNSIVVSCAALFLIGLPTSVETNIYDEAVQEIAVSKKVLQEIEEYQKDALINQYGDTIHYISKILNNLPFAPTYIRRNNNGGKRNIEKIDILNPMIDGITYWSSFNMIKYDLGNDFISKIDKKGLEEWYLENKEKDNITSWSFGYGGNADSIVIQLGNTDRNLSNPRLKFKVSYTGVAYIIQSHNNFIVKKLRQNNLLVKKESIFDESTYRLETFPKLKNSLIWGDLNSVTMEVAESTLQAKAKEKENQKSQTKPFSIFGFSIPPYYAPTIGPFIIIALLLFLLLHLNQLKIELDKSKERDIYPWVGIYGGKGSRFVFATLIVIMPLVACFVAVYFSSLMILQKWGLMFFYILFILLISFRIMCLTYSIILARGNYNGNNTE